MKASLLATAAAAVLMIGAAATTAEAAPLTTGESLTVGDVIFTINQCTSADNACDGAEFEADPNSPIGIVIFNPNGTLLDAGEDLSLFFTVQTVSGEALIDGIDLSFDFVAGDPSPAVGETVVGLAAFNVDSSNPTASARFAPQSSILVTKNMNAGGGAINSVTQSIPQVAEPATLALVSLGLAGLGYGASRQRRKAA